MDLRTDWHGQWVSYDGAGFVATFDWSGCPSQKHVVIYHNHQGNGYRGLNQTKHLVLGSTSPPSLFGPNQAIIAFAGSSPPRPLRHAAAGLDGGRPGEGKDIG